MSGSPPDKKLEVITFGCRLNAYESAVMRREADAAGLGDLDGGAIIVNTCAVTGEAVRQAKQAIRRARRDHPEARIIVSGCAAQTEPHLFGAMAEVDLVLGNAEKLTANAYRALPDFGVNQFEKIRVNDIMEVRQTASHMVEAVDKHSRAFVQVQNGCDHRCTFCVIPYGRGNSRSVPAGEVVRQIGKLVENGYKEVVLTGVDTTSWGADLPGSPKLGVLVRSILDHIPALKRLRLSSIDSIEVDDRLMGVIAEEPRFMPHLHLSLQHGSDLILKRMKRRHSRADAIAFCKRVRALRPDMVFGADLMAGFPTEDEAMFEETLSLIDECGIAFAHVFPFSPRPGTPAARMPQLERGLVRERARRLREKAAAGVTAHLDARIGEIHEVLIEKGGSGRTPQFTKVLVNGGEQIAPGELVRVRIEGHDGERLVGQRIAGERLAERAAVIMAGAA